MDYHCPLRCANFRLRPVAFFRHSGLQPFLDQPQYPRIGHTVLDKLQQPFVVQVVEEPPNIRIQHPVHSLSLNSHRQRIQRIVLASPWPESVGESQKVLFVDPIEDDHHGPLDNFVFQCRDPDRSLPPVGLWDVHPPGWLRSICAPMHPAVQISQSLCQSGFILPPGHSIHSRRRFSFQSVEAVAQQCLRQMMEQRGELFFLPLPCCLTHAGQTLGHSFPALGRTCVGRTDVLLDPRSSLLALRLGLRLVVRAILRYYTSVRLLRCVHAGRAAFRLLPPVCRLFRHRRPGGLPVPVHEVSKRARALRLRGAVRRLAFIAAVHVAFAVRYQLGAPDFFFRSSITRPTYAPVYASMAASRHTTQDSESGWIATSFPVRLFHSLLHAGFDRRTTKPIAWAGWGPKLGGFLRGLHDR